MVCFFVSMKQILFAIFSLLIIKETNAWGFWAHQRINRMAVFTLPPDMFPFYKENIEYLTEHAVDPDKRRYAVEGEAPKHFIDLDHYCTYPCDDFPKSWFQATEKYSSDTLFEYGVVPWTIEWYMQKLTDAFVEKNKAKILKYSADLGHYIADSHVPLHTTENYNGQLSNQKGIHGLWESRLPELFHEDYDFFIGKAFYVDSCNQFIWKNILQAHSHVEDVLAFENETNQETPSDMKYSSVARGATIVKTYSETYSQTYHEKLDGMVEQQMKASIIHVGCLWMTCWVNAGMPNLQQLDKKEWIDEEAKIMVENEGKLKSRSHAATGLDIQIEE